MSLLLKSEVVGAFSMPVVAAVTAFAAVCVAWSVLIGKDHSRC